jgi:hypothetical protein
MRALAASVYSARARRDWRVLDVIEEPRRRVTGWRAAIAHAASRVCLPDIDDRALSGLKFNEALPYHLDVTPLSQGGR